MKLKVHVVNNTCDSKTDQMSALLIALLLIISEFD